MVKQASNYKIVDTREDNPNTIILNSTSQSVFQLSGLYNLSKSWLEFDVLLASLVDHSHKLYVDSPPFQSLYLQTRDGKRLVQIDNFVEYWKTICVPSMSDEKISGNGTFSGATSTAAAKGRCAFANWSNTLSSATPTTMIASSQRITNTGVLVAPNYVLSRNYKALATHIPAALPSALAIKCKVNLGDIMHTILSRNIDLGSVDNLELVINWLPGVQWGVDDGTSVASNGDLVEFTVVPVMSNLRLQLAVQQNPEIVSRYFSQLNSGGINLVVDNVYAYRQSLGTSTTASASMRINPGHGSHLQRLVFCPIVTSQTLAKRANMYNVAGTLVTNYDSVKFDVIVDAMIKCRFTAQPTYH